MTGLEKNKCADCEGSGVGEGSGDGRPFDCPACKGTGKKKRANPEGYCEECNGNGYFFRPDESREKVNCVFCKGTGKKAEAPAEQGKISKDPESPRYRRVETPRGLAYVKEEKPSAAPTPEAPPAKPCPKCKGDGLWYINKFDCETCADCEGSGKEKITPPTPEPLTLSAYSEQSRGNASYNGRSSSLGLAYSALGLAGEAGEVAEKIKKVLRDSGGEITPEIQEKIARELGDALWYLDAVAFESGLSLERVARLNLEKLADRRARGVISGNGDNR